MKVQVALVVTNRVMCSVISRKKAQNISYLVQFSLAVPVSSAAIKNPFSLINDLWSDERNTLTLETVKAEIIKTHLCIVL